MDSHLKQYYIHLFYSFQHSSLPPPPTPYHHHPRPPITDTRPSASYPWHMVDVSYPTPTAQPSLSTLTHTPPSDLTWVAYLAHRWVLFLQIFLHPWLTALPHPSHHPHPHTPSMAHTSPSTLTPHPAPLHLTQHPQPPSASTLTHTPPSTLIHTFTHHSHPHPHPHPSSPRI